MILKNFVSYPRLLNDGESGINRMEDTEWTEAMMKSLERYLEELKLQVKIRPYFMI